MCLIRYHGFLCGHSIPGKEPILEMPCRRLHRLPHEPMCNPPIYSTKITKPEFCGECQKVFDEFRPKWAERKAKLLGQPLTAGQLKQERKDRVAVLKHEVMIQGLTEGPSTSNMTSKIQEANELLLNSAENLAGLINRKRHVYEYETGRLNKTGGMTEAAFEMGEGKIKASEEKFELDIDRQFIEQQNVLSELNGTRERSEDYHEGVTKEVPYI